jgi:NADH-quinone oxidoreductase subunit L
MFKVVFLVFFGPNPTNPTNPTNHSNHGDPSLVMSAPLWVLAIAAVTIGLYFTVYRVEPEFISPGWLTPVAVTVALSGIAGAWLTYQRQIISADTLATVFGPVRKAALAKFWLDDIYQAIYRHVLLAFARLIGWTDRYIVDGVLNVISAWTLDGGDALRRIQTGRVGDYIFAVGAGLLVLMLWMRGTL